MNVKDNVIEIAGAKHYVARASVATTAGVLLLPTVAGIDDFACGYAESLAETGLTTLVWNPYPEVAMGSPLDDVRPLSTKLNDAATAQTLSGCVDTLERELGVKTVATIGFCMGGRYVLVFAARERRLRAAVAVYPSVRAQRAQHQDVEPAIAAAAIACPVQMLYPGRDHVTPRAVFETLQAALQSRSVETSIQLYPDAEHGFFHHEGAANAAAARSARPQIEAFLKAHL
jgi:carboxymethylenebutenolidase